MGILDRLFGKQAKVEEVTSFENTYSYDASADNDLCRRRLLQVLAEEFPQYTVREELSPDILGAVGGGFMEISIAVFDGDTPLLFMMIIGKTTCAHKAYKLTKMWADDRNVPFINFIRHYPNEIEYIKDRLHKYL